MQFAFLLRKNEQLAAIHVSRHAAGVQELDKGLYHRAAAINVQHCALRSPALQFRVKRW